jgi:hypothetical protein
MGKCWSKQSIEESAARTDKVKAMVDQEVEERMEMGEYVKVKKLKKALIAMV